MLDQSIEKDFITAWKDMVPKILKLSEDYECTGLQQFLDLYSRDNVSDGKLLAIISVGLAYQSYSYRLPKYFGLRLSCLYGSRC